MSYKIVWKLCERYNGMMYSAVAYGDRVRAYYSIGKSTKPKVGLLFAFDTKENAFNAIPSINYNAIIVKCKARISRRPVPEYVALFDYYEEYWDCLFGIVTRGYNKSKREMPAGTIFCTEVIPIAIVDQGVEKRNER